MLFANPTPGHGQWLEHVADEETGPLVEADGRVKGVIGLRVKPQEVFHESNEPGVDLPQAPGLGKVRFQLVFFRMVPIWVEEISAQ
jgi:hypothetical protein